MTPKKTHCLFLMVACKGKAQQCIMFRIGKLGECASLNRVMRVFYIFGSIVDLL